MKVFISADIEGTADLASFDEAGMENPRLYARGCEQMSREVGAACRGAEKAGADFVAVKDAHGGSMNLMHEYLPEIATLIRGETRTPYSMIGGIDSSYDAIMFIGYHDAAGSDGNPMAHTISSRRIRRITINGRTASELDMFAYAAAYLGVPTTLVAGDETLCSRAKAINGNIVTVCTKKGIGAAVASLHPAKVEKLIEEKAGEALSGDLGRYSTTLPKEFRITVEFIKHYDAARGSNYPGATRPDCNTIAFSTSDYYEALRFFYFVL